MPSRVGPSLPRTIEMTPNGSGGYVPDFNISPNTAGPLVRSGGYGQQTPDAPYALPPSSSPRYNIPDAAPAQPSGTRGMNAQDAADFGTDQYGRPVVTRRPGTNEYEFNPELGFTPDEMRRANDDINRGGSGSTRGGDSLGRALNGLENFNNVLDPFGTGAAAEWFSNGIAGAVRRGADNIARYIFPELPNTWLPGAPSGRPVPGGQGQGQAPGVLYDIEVECECEFFAFSNSPVPSHRYVGYYIGEFVGPYEGIPLPGVLSGGLGDATPAALLTGQAAGQGFELTGIAAVPNYSKRRGNNQAAGPLLRVTIRRRDGQPEIQPVPTAPTYPSPSPFPSPSPSPLPSPSPSPFPSPSPLPFPVPNPFPDRDGDGIPDAVDPFPDDPSPYPNPFPDTSNPGEPPDAPTPNDDCCLGTSLSLAEVLSLLNKALAKLDGHGKAVFDLAPCESEIDPAHPPDPLAGAYEGEGLTGIYAAIAQITESLNLVRADTKCSPPINAALPMFWEVKSGEVPQFNVLWKPSDGGNSRWAMSIPHPRTDLGVNSLYNFPSYEKGPNMATMKLRDNSKVIINVASKSEAVRVLNYVYSLIDPLFRLETISYTYSENVSTARNVNVSACYIKKFEGHRTVAPLWARAL